jgi:drug/metabolite transporter (DMT)-like permease
MNEHGARRRFEPVFLLLAAGFCIGLIFPLGRLATENGVAPLFYAGASAAGASVVLALIAAGSGQRISVDAAIARYAAIAGQLTFAIPFGVLMLVIPHLGSGMPAILQSLAPILTLAIVLGIGMEYPNVQRAAGLAAGLAGAIIILVVRNQGSLETNATVAWYLAALITPAALALGNVFRTTHWPSGQEPLPLAALTLAAAALGLFAALVVGEAFGYRTGMPGALASGWLPIGLQSVATGVGYAFFFRLQQVGGPVYLSQISYVNTAVGLAFAVAFFAERFSPWVWAAVVLVFAGVALVNRTQGSTDAAKRQRRVDTS